MQKTNQQTQPLGDLWSSREVGCSSEPSSRSIGLLSLAVAVVIFFVDRAASYSIPVNVLYVVVLYLTARLSRPRYFWIGVFGCTGLILVDLVLSLPSHDPHTVVVNGSVSLLINWFVGWVLWRHFNEKLEWIEREQQLEGNLYELTRQLGEARVRVETSLQKRQEVEQALTDLNHTLSRQNQELETILSVTSHDLRSPLVNVQGFGKELAKACASLQTICEQAVSSDSQKRAMVSIVQQEIPEALHYILAGAKKMEILLQGVLRLAQLGRLAIKNERLDMNEMIAGIAAGMEYQLKEKEVVLQIDDLPECLGDATLVNQLFCNLLDNACKYLDPVRSGIIQICGLRDGEWARYTVKDNGTGILQEHQDKIFQMFYRLNPSEIRGDGLGLTIVRRIIDRHQGVIKLESFPGTGTTFTISLPAG